MDAKPPSASTGARILVAILCFALMVFALLSLGKPTSDKTTPQNIRITQLPREGVYSTGKKVITKFDRIEDFVTKEVRATEKEVEVLHAEIETIEDLERETENIVLEFEKSAIELRGAPLLERKETMRDLTERQMHLIQISGKIYRDALPEADVAQKQIQELREKLLHAGYAANKTLMDGDTSPHPRP